MSSSSSSSPCNSPSAITVPPSIAVANNVGSPTPQVADPTVVMSPCAACKILRRRCSTDKCVLAPYFPPTDPLKFTIAHKVFGASNIIKLLQDLPEDQRADAVSSMVYEANARLRDPVYGCAGAIWQLQKQVSDMQAELAKAQAEIVNMKCQQANLLALFCMEMSQDANKPPSPPQDSYESINNHDSFLNIYEENNNLNSIWEPLWT